jgi:hypothetical protein
MNTQYTFKVIGGALILSILIGAGFFAYLQWDLRRFKVSLEELPALATSPEPVSPRDIAATERSGHVTSPMTVKTERLEYQMSELNGLDMEPEELWLDETDMWEFDWEIDGLLLSEVELPDLVSDEPVEGVAYTYTEHDISSFPDLLKSAYGDSEDADLVDEVLTRSEAGTATRDDAISMAEALLRIIPEDQYENRRSVMKFLEDIYELKRHEESTPTIVTKVEFSTTIAPEE